MEPTLAVLEDNDYSFQTLEGHLHVVLGDSVIIQRAKTVEEAKDIINNGSATVIFVDSRLSPGIAPLGQEGAEGLELARMAKAKNQNALVVDFSLNGRVLNSPDLKLGKTKLGDPLALQQALTKLCVLIANQQTR